MGCIFEAGFGLARLASGDYNRFYRLGKGRCRQESLADAGHRC
jgi:hypothetical protein